MIIFLNGSINSGKSTIANLLAKELPKIALVEIDAFHEMIEWMPIDEAVPLNLENALTVIRNFITKDLNVIIPYPLSQKNYNYFVAGLKDLDIETHIFTLAPKLEKALINRGTRELTDWERQRIQHHYDVGINKPNFGEIIDNTNQTPEETTKIILNKIHHNC
jgi:adenylate kinase family enzyme